MTLVDRSQERLYQAGGSIEGNSTYLRDYGRQCGNTLVIPSFGTTIFPNAVIGRRGNRVLNRLDVRILSSPKSTPAQKRVAASDLAQAKPKPKKK